MSNEQKAQEAQQGAGGQAQPQGQQQDQSSQQGQGGSQQTDFDGLQDKKPEELTPEELRLMADTMPGEGPGD